MTPRTSIIGRIVHLRLFSRLFGRALVFAPIIGILLLLSAFPERYEATASMTPTDSAGMGLSGTVGQLGAIDNVFGNQAAVEVALRMAKSVYVRDLVINDTHLSDRMRGLDHLALERWLGRHVEVRSLRGSIIVVELQDHDPVLARDIVANYVRDTQQQLAVVARRQTAYKREVLRTLVFDATNELADAQDKYDNYRLAHHYADPRTSMASIGDRIPTLEATIKARQVALSTARQAYTDDNIIVKQQMAELAALQGQLAAAKATTSQDDQSVGTAVGNSRELFLLERNLNVARVLYDNYMRYLQGTAVEDLTSTVSMRVIEQAYIDTRRQYYMPTLAGALAFFLLWMAIEFYRLRPPIGDPLEGRAHP